MGSGMAGMAGMHTKVVYGVGGGLVNRSCFTIAQGWGTWGCW